MTTAFIYPDRDIMHYQFNGAADQLQDDTSQTSQIGSTSGKYGPDYKRLLFHFPLTAIPAGVLITAASFVAYKYTNSGTGTNIGVDRVTNAWTEANTTNPVPIPTYGGSNLASNAIYSNAAQGYLQWDGLGTLVNNWYTGAWANNGLALYGPVAGSDWGAWFYMREYTGTSQDPYLAVTYNSAPGAPVVLTPNGGETVDQSYNITWTAASDPEGDALQYQIQLSTDGGGIWNNIVALTSGTSYLWNSSVVAATTTALIRIRAWDGFQYGPWDQSNAVFSVSHVLATPTAVTPTAGSTVTSDVPTLGATLQAGGSQKAEWQLATDTAFTANLRTVTESDADVRTSGATTEVVPNVSQLFQGTWYVRARAVPPSGGASAPSNWSAYNSFTVTHPPVPANQSPTGDTKRPYGGAGTTVFDWDFSDTSPVDTQTAYQVQVEVNATGVSVLDSGKVASINTQASLNIPVGQKDVLLRWRARLWDSDDVTGGYSAYQLFRVADVPTVTITDPVHNGQITQPAPTISWTFVASAGRTQTDYRVRYVRVSDGATIHDSGWIAGAGTSYLTPSPVLTLNVVYDVVVDLRDTWGLEGTDTNRATATWLSPASPIFTVLA
jgi:hypothetical protein